MPPARRKPAAKQRSDSAGDSESDDGVDDVKVSLERYRALQLAWALATWEHNARAIKELRVLFEDVYMKLADKSVQAAMLDDLMVALTQAERMGRLGPTLDGLVSAALRVLPKQKRNAVATAHRQAVVQQRREARRRGGSHGVPAGGIGGDSSDECDEADSCGPRLPSLHDLPLEVIEAVFQHLGPVELSRCACVSRNWREVAVSPHMDMVWRQLFQLTFPRSTLAAAAGPGGAAAPLAPAYIAFTTAAHGKPRRLLRWSGRVLRSGSLCWVCTDELRRLPASALRVLGFPTEGQVVQWACGIRQRLASDSSSSSGASDSDEASDSNDEQSDRLARMKLWAVTAVP